MSYEEIAKLTGQTSFEAGSNLPRLSINYEADDDAGNTLPRGAFKIYNPEIEGDMYSKTVQFTPILSKYQYSVYDEKENNFPIQSTLFTSWGEPILDTMGNEFRAAKYKKSMLAMDPSLEPKLKCTRLLYGIVTMQSPVDKTGKKLDDISTPCFYSAKGANFSPFSEALDALSKQKKLMHNNPLQISTKREKNGGTTYFVCEIVVPDKETKAEGFDVNQLVSDFLAVIDADNKRVISKYEEIKRKSKRADDDFAKDFSLESNGARKLSNKVEPTLNDPIEDLLGA